MPASAPEAHQPPSLGLNSLAAGLVLRENLSIMRASKQKEAQKQLKRNEEKWSATLMAAGWTVLPSVILERQQGLGLDAIDLNIILQLAKHWWEADNPPFPSKRAIAECMGVDPSTVRRRIQRLEAHGLLRRCRRFGSDGRQQTNAYVFDGLIAAAKPFAEEAIETRNMRRKENVERRTRKRPKRTELKLVRADGETTGGTS